MGAFKKKHGFFDEAAEYLQALEAEVKGDEKEFKEKQYQKFLQKIWRDLARIYALKRDKEAANRYH